MHLFKQQDVTGKVENTWFLGDLRRWVFVAILANVVAGDPEEGR